ncbi:MAG: FHA domain-containing protein [Acidobacteria bacterium]|nr:FHA domain-containing protein [Acidobacteriota bacterium]
MLEVRLKCKGPEGERTITVAEGRISFGRGSDADERFEDNSLSRLHATLYREGDRVWIVDDNSSNGTFVNGDAVPAVGKPLANGDRIKLGNDTVLMVEIAAPAKAEAPKAAAASPGITASSGVPSGLGLLPIVMIGFAFMIVSLSLALIGYKLLGWGEPAVVRADDDVEFSDPEPRSSRDSDPKKTPDSPSNSGSSTSGSTSSSDSNSNEPLDIKTPESSKPEPSVIPQGKRYLDLSEDEKRKYVADRSMRIAAIIGNSSSDTIPAEAVEKIKSFTDAYAKRINVKPLGGCRFGDNLQATYERASKNAPFIVRAFNARGIDPRIGLYLAMIESEHCVCLQSPTGPLGMFQFTKATGENHGLKTISGASPNNPDERCEPEPSARAAASYMKSLTGRYGTGPASVPLAIGSYNSGEGGLSSNLVKALESGSGLPRDFWTLISKGDMLSKQFQSENFKYVPKFFAAAIVGEFPQDFGLKLQPVSTYTK